MPQRIEVPQLGLLEFPDGMTDSDIADAIDGEIARNNPKLDFRGPTPSEANLGLGIPDIQDNNVFRTLGAARRVGQEQERIAKAGEFQKEYADINQYFDTMMSAVPSDNLQKRTDIANAKAMAVQKLNEKASVQRIPFNVIGYEEQKPFVEPVGPEQYVRDVGEILPGGELGKTSANVLSGLQQVGAGFLEMFKDPVVLGSLGLAKAAPESAIALGRAFGLQMLANSPSQAKALYESWKQGDTAGVIRDVGNLAIAAGLGAKLTSLTDQPIGAQNASAIRSDTGQLREVGQVPERSQEISRNDLEQAAPEQPQPVVPRVEPSPEAQVIPQPQPPEIVPATETKPPELMTPERVRREPRLFRDMPDEEIYNALQNFRGRYKPGMPISSIITKMREELAWREGLPEGTLWGNFGFLKEGEQPTPPSPKTEAKPAETTPVSARGSSTTFDNLIKEHGGETLTQRDLFAIQDLTKEVDPFKSANAAERMYGKDAISKIQNQIRVMDIDPEVRKSFTKEQRGRLAEVLNVLRQRGLGQEPPRQGPPPISMGGMAAVERPTPQTPTGIKNATVDAERAKRGLPPAVQPARRTFGRVWDEAMAKIDNEPEWLDGITDSAGNIVKEGLIDELRRKPRALTDIEDAALLYRQIDLQNEYGKATRELAQAYEDGRLDQVEHLKVLTAGWSDKLLDLYNIGKQAGTATGQGLAARKMMAYEDFSLAQMELSKRAANGGRQLTEKEQKEIQALHDKIAELQKRYDDLEAKTAQRRTAVDTKEAVGVAVSVAKKRTASNKKTGIVRDLAAEQANVVQRLKESIIENDGDISGETMTIRKLMELLVEREGITDRLKMEDRVHEILTKDVDPTLTREETMDLMSGYGKSKLPNPAFAKKTVRDINAQILSVRKLLDYFKGQQPKLTGQLRDAPSDIQRAWLKMVNEAKKSFKLDVQADNAKSVKSALATIKTRLNNRLRDLKQEVATRQRIIRQRNPSPYDAETLRLQKEIEEIKKIHDEIFGTELTDAQRLDRAEKTAQRQIEELQRQIQSGEIFPKAKKPFELTSPALEAAKARLEELRLQRQFAREAIQPKAEPHEIAALNYLLRLRRRTAELNDRVARGDFSGRPKKPTLESPDIMAAKAELFRAKQKFQRGLIEDRLKNRPWWIKSQDTFLRWYRGGILSSPVVFAKLTVAAILRAGITPVEQVIGSGVGKVFPRLYERAKFERGWNSRAEAKAITSQLTKGPRDAWDILTKGETALDVLYGRGREGAIGESQVRPFSIADIPGRTHGAWKASTKRAEFERRLEMGLTRDIENGIDASDPAIQLANAVEAYKYANRSIFLQDNRVVSAYQAALRRLEQPNKATGQPTVGGKAGATVARTLIPIVRVPSNIVAEAFQFAFGSVTGLPKLARAYAKGIETLPVEQADLIMRELKKGSIGGAALVLGYLLPNMFGGYYQRGERRKKTDVAAGGARINGVDISPKLMHHPVFEAVNVGATVRRVSESKQGREAGDLAIPLGISAAALGLIETTPFVREMIDTAKAFNPSEQNAYFGELAKSISEPQLLQWIAKQKDVNSAGEPIARKPKTFVQHLEMGIPGLRQNVPRKRVEPIRVISPSVHRKF